MHFTVTKKWILQVTSTWMEPWGNVLSQSEWGKRPCTDDLTHLWCLKKQSKGSDGTEWPQGLGFGLENWDYKLGGGGEWLKSWIRGIIGSLVEDCGTLMMMRCSNCYQDHKCQHYCKHDLNWNNNKKEKKNMYFRLRNRQLLLCNSKCLNAWVCVALADAEYLIKILLLMTIMIIFIIFWAMPSRAQG